MDIQANTCAKSCVDAINAQFPNSVRAKRLRVLDSAIQASATKISFHEGDAVRVDEQLDTCRECL